MKQIVIVTQNKYKEWEFSEGFRSYMPDINILFKSQKFREFCCVSSEENIKNKALQAFQKFKAPVLVDDTILLFRRYTNFPGIHAKWLMDSIGINGVLRLIDEEDKALFRCHLAFYDGKIFKIFRGEIKGRLKIKIDYKKIKKGLDYSTFFLPEGEKVPMADFYRSRVFLNSHRMKAIKKFSQFLQKYYGNS